MSLDPKTIQRRLRELDPGLLPDNERHAAVALVLRCGTAPSVLLMRRAERAGDPWSGQVSLPGGHAEDQDADLLATARRETREEIGLPLEECTQLLGRLPALQARARRRRLPLYVAPFVFQEIVEAQPALGPEAARTFWMPLAQARNGDLDAPYKHMEGPGEIERTYPSWRWDGETIWGMTRQILHSLLEATWPRSGPTCQ